MNPHAKQPTSLASLGRSLWHHRNLIIQMTKREVVGRYRGSALGLAWSFLTPLLMLSVYTFVFSVVFKARWGISPEGVEESRMTFAIMLFVGLIVHGIFAEVLNRAPHLIIGNVNYVKKVVFPVEILPVISMCAALFHGIISLFVLLLVYTMVFGVPHWTIIFIPVVVAPLLILTLGIAWILASLGVFLRDVGQTIGILTTVMLFLSPVFFPLNALPEKIQPLIMANPLTFIIEQARDVLILGKLPDAQGLGIYTAVAVIMAWVGFAWFQKTRKGFADVL